MIFNNTNTIMVDVRTKEEYDLETLKGAISIPLNGIHETLMKMSPGQIKSSDNEILDNEYIVFCDSGKRSLEAFIIFKKHGFKVFNGGPLMASNE